MNAFASAPTLAISSALFDVEQFSVLGELGDEGDAEVIAEVVSQFLDDVDPTLEKLEVSIGQRDFQRVSDLAHTLKGSFATFGLMRAHACAREIERDAQAEHAEALLSFHHTMVGYFLAGKRALRAHMGGRALVAA